MIENTINYDKQANQFIIKFKYDSVLVDAIKSTFKYRKYDPETKQWIIKDEIEKITSFAMDYNFKFDISEYQPTNIKNKIIIENNKARIIFNTNDYNLEYQFKTDLKRFFYPIIYNNNEYIVYISSFDNSIGSINGLKEISNKYNIPFDDKELSIQNNNQIDLGKFEKLLLPFQKEGVNEIINKKRILVADDMGLGKTLQTITAIDIQKLYPALIICPAVLKLNWELEYKKWNKDVTVSVWSTNKNNEIKDVNIINYDILEKFKDELLNYNFKVLVVDESHYIKNAKAKRTKITKQIAKKCDNKILLSGTPINNKPVELVSQLDVLGFLPYFGGSWGFLNKYCDAHKNDFGYWDFNGSSNLDDLHKRLKIIGFIRRTKKEVLQDLPDKTINIIPIELDNINKYKAAEKDLISFIKEKALNDVQFYGSLNGKSEDEKKNLMKLHAEDKEHKAMLAEHLVRYEALKQLTAELKESSIYEWIENFMQSSDEKLVVFAKHNNIIEKLVDKYNCLYIEGGMSSESKMKMINDFQSDNNKNDQDKNARLIIINIDAGREGITLTKSSNVLFIELPWTPLELIQAEDRVYRIGQKNSVNIWYLIARDTIEEDILDLIISKRNIMDKILDGVEITNDTKNIIDEMNEKLKNKFNLN